MHKTGIVLSFLILCPVASFADKLDKESKAWLDGVRAILTVEEEKLFNGLKDKADRDEFQKIFWARRNPGGPDKEPNDFKAGFEKAKAVADERFKGFGVPGSQTDCGRAFILIGEPSEIKKTEENNGDIWEFRDRPGFQFPSGKVDILFSRSCALEAVDSAPRIREFLDKIAKSKIVSPQVAIKVGSDGHLQKLQEFLPKPTAIQALFKEPRTDFPATGEATMFVKTEEADYLAGLVRGDGQSLSAQAAGDKKTAKVTVAVQAQDDAGHKFQAPEREANVDIDKDGSFVVSYGVILKPGAYQVKVAVLDPKAGKGTLVTVPVKAPDLQSEEVNTSSLLVLKDIVDVDKNPLDPLANFVMDKTLLVPRFGNAFTVADSVTLMCMVYGGKVDPTTQKPSLTVQMSISKDGKVVAKAPDQTFDKAAFADTVGPVPLSKYTPGKYTVELRVLDNVTKKDTSREATFDVH
jgi:GWxTD domain-containing protein